MPNFIKGLPAEASSLKSSEMRNNFLALDARTGKIACRATIPANTSVTTDPGTVYFADRISVKLDGQKINLGDADTGITPFINIGFFKDVAIVARVSFNATTQSHEAVTLFIEGPEKASSVADKSIVPIRSTDLPIARFIVRHNGISLTERGQIEPITQIQITDFRNYLDVGGLTYYSATVGDRLVSVDSYGVLATDAYGAAVISGETSGSYVGNIKDSLGNIVTPIVQAIEDLASTGGTIFIRRGTYMISETLVLPSNVSLLGEGSSTILQVDSNFSGPVIQITGNRVSVTNLVISGAGVGTLIALVASTNCTIKDCFVLNGVTGLELDTSSTRNIITNNYIKDNDVGVNLADNTKNILALNQFDNNLANYSPASPTGHQLIGNMT